jgi:hypothetical protein
MLATDIRNNPKAPSLALSVRTAMSRLAASLVVAALALLPSAPAYAQAGAGPAKPPGADKAKAGAPAQPAKPTAPALEAKAPSADDVCHALEVAAAENELPVEFFARVIWQESRFNALAVSSKGAEGIAQFMPATADHRGLADPFNPIEALKQSARYLGELRKQFGNLGLAAASYNAGPGRVSAWLAGERGLPGETRNYVATVTGWTADEWASPSPPKAAESAVPPGVPCTQLAHLILAPKGEAQRIAAYVPRWGLRLAAHVVESKAWEIYREDQRRFAKLIGDRQPIVLHTLLPGMGVAKRYVITIADDDRAPLAKLCAKMMAAGGACVVLRNGRG